MSVAEARESALTASAPATLTVAHVIHSLGAGGAEEMLVELARVATSAGLRLIVIGISDARCETGIDNRAAEKLRDCGATVYEIHARRYDPTSVAKIARLLAAEHVDIVHTHLKHADIVGGLAARLARVPSVSTLHVIDIANSPLHRLRVTTAVRARRHLAGVVIAISEAQRRWYRGKAGPGASITLLPNGIAEPRSTRSRASVRAELGVDSGGVLALCVSLMRPEKGHVDLIEAIRELPADSPIVVAMAGDGPCLQSIQSAVANDPAVRERVRVLGFRSDIAELLTACDFVVQPSLEDALPTALISALACGKPILATNVGGIPDIVGPGCGVLVEPGCRSALCAGLVAMANAVSSGGLAPRDMGRAARARYESRFSADTWVNDLRSMYERELGTTRRRRFVLVEFPPSGGLFQFALQLGEGLARAGCDVELITGPSPEMRSREPGCRVRGILPTWHPTAGSAVPGWWRRARRGIRAVRHTAAWAVLIGYLLVTGPDVVLWSAWRFPVDGWAVHLVRKVLPNTVLALVAHEPRPLVEQPGQSGVYKTSRMATGALAAAYADLDVAYVLGESARQVLTDTWPITAPVRVIPHGDEGIFASEPIPGVENTDPVALAFGTITAYKGIDTLCQAWPTVRAQVPDAELVIAGALSADVDEAALRSQVARLAGVDLRIGYVPLPDVPAYFARARCVVLPYKRSSQSGVAHLAHTLGRPVVATRVGDIPTVVRDEFSGLLVDPEAPAALAAAIVRLLTDPDAAQRMGEAGAKSLAGEASWDDVAAQIYRGLPDTRRP